MRKKIFCTFFINSVAFHKSWFSPTNLELIHVNLCCPLDNLPFWGLLHSIVKLLFEKCGYANRTKKATKKAHSCWVEFIRVGGLKTISHRNLFVTQKYLCFRRFSDEICHVKLHMYVFWSLEYLNKIFIHFCWKKPEVI